MKKRTKIELIVFCVIAAFYLFTQFANIGGRSDGNDVNSSKTAGIETELVAGEGALEEDAKAAQGSAEEDLGAEADGNRDSTDIADTEANKAAYGESSHVKQEDDISEDGVYSDKEQVALFIATYGHLPKNYISKNDAKAAGWRSNEGNLSEVCPGMSIGGDKFGNYDGKLPEKRGRKYFECDVNYDPDDGHRGSERIIYSNDGLIYYTGDHYNNFELLYGEP